MAVTGYELIERASELCEQIAERVFVEHPTPRQLAHAALELNEARWRNTGHAFEPKCLVMAMWYLVPPFNR